MKKSFSGPFMILLSFVIIVAISLIPVFAATYVEDGDWKYEIVGNNTEYYIESYLGTSNRVSVPALYQQKKVTKINSEAFLNNTSLMYVEFPATVTSIGANAFYGCTALKSLTIPAEITSIGSNAFYGCNSLVSVSFKHNTGVKSIPLHCFNNCLSLSTAVIALGTERIEAYAFSGCTSLSTVIIPPSVTYIADTAFLGCKNLVISGWEDTYAQQFAQDNGIKYISYGTYVEPTTAVQTEPVTTVPVTTAPVTTAPTDPSEPVTTAPVTTAPTDPSVPVTTAPVTTSPTDPSEPVTTAPTYPSQPSTTVPTTTVPIITTDPTATQKPTSNTKTYLIGDCDLDSKVTVKDATTIQKASAELISLDNIQKFLANCDGTDGVNIKDATQIQKYCAGFLNILFVGTEVQI